MKYTNEELAVLAKTDKVYADILIRRNVKLVYTIAHQYKMPGVEFEDRVQDGLIGMYESIKSYDPEKGMFSTHASNWVRAYIIRAGNEQSNTIRLPSHIVELRVRIANLINRISKTEGVMPTVERLHKEVNASGARTYSIEDIKHMMAINDSTIPASLDTSAHNSDGDEVNAHELLGGRMLETDIIRDERMEKLLEVVNNLDPTSRYVVSKVIGLNGFMPTPYREMDQQVFDVNGNTMSFTAINNMYGDLQKYLASVMQGETRLVNRLKFMNAIKCVDVVIVVSAKTKKIFISADPMLTMNRAYNYKATLQMMPEVGDILREDPAASVVCYRTVQVENVLAELENAIDAAMEIADKIDGEVICPEFMAALEIA